MESRQTRVILHLLGMTSIWTSPTEVEAQIAHLQFCELESPDNALLARENRTQIEQTHTEIRPILHSQRTPREYASLQARLEGEVRDRVMPDPIA
jgi:hypothetical protein